MFLALLSWKKLSQKLLKRRGNWNLATARWMPITSFASVHRASRVTFSLICWFLGIQWRWWLPWRRRWVVRWSAVRGLRMLRKPFSAWINRDFYPSRKWLQHDATWTRHETLLHLLQFTFDEAKTWRLCAAVVSILLEVIYSSLDVMQFFYYFYANSCCKLQWIAIGLEIHSVVAMCIARDYYLLEQMSCRMKHWRNAFEELQKRFDVWVDVVKSVAHV